MPASGNQLEHTMWTINKLITYRIPSRRPYLKKIDTDQKYDTYVPAEGYVLFVTIRNEHPMKVERIYHSRSGYRVYTSNETFTIDCMTDAFELYSMVNPV